MISWHPNQSFDPRVYHHGFQVADVLDMWRLSRCIRRFCWSPIQWKWGARSQKNFLKARLCALDFDDGEMTLAQAMDTFCDMRHVIGTTKSHRKNKNGVIADRFRVVLVFSEDIRDPRLYRFNMNCMRRYPIDRACKDAARFFYPCNEIVSVSDDEEDYAVDVRKDIPKNFEKTDYERLRYYRDAHTIPREILIRLQHPIPKGERNKTVYGLAKDLCFLGIDYERILELLVSSQAIDLGEEEIIRTVRNGVDKALAELAERG